MKSFQSSGSAGTFGNLGSAGTLPETSEVWERSGNFGSVGITFGNSGKSLGRYFDIFAAYKFQGPVLSEMSGEGVIVLIVKNTKTEVVGVGDIDMVVQTEETVGVD